MSKKHSNEALELCRNLTEEEQRLFDSFWDMEFLRNNRDMTMENIGIEKGRAERRAEGRAEGLAEGERKAKLETARSLKSMGMPIDQIAKATNLTPNENIDL